MTNRTAVYFVFQFVMLWIAIAVPLPAQVRDARFTDDAPAKVLSSQAWERADDAVARALAWLALQQQPDGSFRTLDTGQPAVTSLCVLAFMAHGHLPGEGPYGQRLDRALDFIMSCQKESGLVALVGPDGPRVSRNVPHEIGSTASYNHAISSFVLSEAYGMSGPVRAARMGPIIQRSIAVSLEMQRWPKVRAEDRGGWRYIDVFSEIDADLSVSGWYLMGLRSARNAGFAVPEGPINDAIDYVRRSFDERYGTFRYMVDNRDIRGRGMAGAGILALGHAGFHSSHEAQSSGEFLLRFGFDSYNSIGTFAPRDRYHYGMFTCCQGMYQLGGSYWAQFFPRVVEVLLANQRPDGSWNVESHRNDAPFGNAYTTALVVLALGAPNQLLPIFQR